MLTQKSETANINTSEKIIDTLANDILKIRAKICYAIIITFAIIAIPALTASLSRITAIGWQPVMIAHIVITILLWCFVIFRTRAPYHIQAGFVVVIFFVIGLGGLIQFGLITGAIAFIVSTSPIATLLFGGRTGAISLIAVLISTAIIGLLTTTGQITHAIDLTAYVIAPTSWLTVIFGMALTSAVLTVSLHVFNNNLLNTLKVSRQHEKALQLSKERLAMVIEGSEQGFWDWNIVTGEVQRNERWAQMLGYETIEEFESNTDSWTNAIHPDDRESAWASIQDHLKGRTDRHKLEYRMLKKDGGYKWILDHAKIVQRDANDKPLRMSGTHTDITERKKLEQEKEELIDSLQQALNELKVLQGIIPICSYCHNIRDDEGSWNKIEAYISKHSDAEFSHGICPKCLHKARADAGLKNKE